ncbi:hypothetical protein Tco_1473934 [Tanacetum coccineum]
MASQDARLFKFEADFKQQQSKMTNKIDTVLKAITGQITRALLSDTVKNPKLNDQLKTVMEIGTQQSEEPERTLEDEFQDLHLNLPVLEKDPETHLLVERGFLATANAMIDCRKAKIAVEEGITRSVFGVKEIDLGAQTPYYVRKEFLNSHFVGEWEMAMDAEINPFKDVLVLCSIRQEVTNRIACRNFFQENECKVFTEAGDDVRIIPDSVRKTYLLEDKQIPSVGVFDERLKEIHVTWAYLEKKQTRLRLYTKSLEEIIIQTVETASPTLATTSELDQDDVRNITTASECSRLK